jgi:ABC-type sugar transport system permease subunit
VRRPRQHRPWGAIAIFLGPTVVLYAAFCIYPVLVTFYNSFHTLRMDLGMLSEFVGLEHFREILTADDVFWKAARNSLVWGVVAPLIDIPARLRAGPRASTRGCRSRASSGPSGSRRS